MAEKFIIRCKLRSLMEARGITQEKLWKETGISKDSIRALQNSSSILIHLPTVVKILVFLNCEIEELLVMELEK